MKKISIAIFVIGVAITIFCLVYFKTVVNAVDSDAVSVGGSGAMASEWPIFIGILTTFVGAVFFYVSREEEKAA